MRCVFPSFLYCWKKWLLYSDTSEKSIGMHFAAKSWSFRPMVINMKRNLKNHIYLKLNKQNVNLKLRNVMETQSVKIIWDGAAYLFFIILELSKGIFLSSRYDLWYQTNLISHTYVKLHIIYIIEWCYLSFFQNLRFNTLISKLHFPNLC